MEADSARNLIGVGVRLPELAVPYRPYPPAVPALVVRDPVVDLPPDHLARLVDQVVDEVVHPEVRPLGPGQPPYNPRLCLKVLVYGYAVGIRSSRRLEQLCDREPPVTRS